jgi:hypothetical protein
VFCDSINVTIKICLYIKQRYKLSELNMKRLSLPNQSFENYFTFPSNDYRDFVAGISALNILEQFLS